MTRRLFHYGLLALVVIATAAAFSVTRRLDQRESGNCTRDWLCLSPDQCQQIRQEDPDFKEQTQTLSQNLQTHQQRLIDQIGDSNTPNKAIQIQAQMVVETHHDLMRRIVQHLLVVRRYTDPQQCLQLNGLCANVLGGQGQGRGQGLHGSGRGRGRGQGLGNGMGRGRRFRGGRLAPVLALTEAQQEEVWQQDPTFDAEVAVLSETARSCHRRFIQQLSDLNLPDDTIQNSLEDLIVARGQLEKRTIDYVLRIRPLLSTEQQQRLIGLSRQGCRWRGGQGPY